MNIFTAYCRSLGIPEPVTEYRWHPTRKFRADYAWPEQNLILEVEGGIWNSGKHGRGSGIVKDIEKQNEASAHGWMVLRVQPQDLLKLTTIELIRRTMEARKAA